MTLFVVVLAGAILPFTPQGRQMLRAAKRLIERPEPVAVPDEAELKRVLEAELREGIEKEFEAKLEAAKRSLVAEAEKREREAEEKRRKEAVLPPLTAHTAASGGDVRKLRSGIPFKSNVKVESGTIASKERTDDGSYTAEYTLTLIFPDA